MSAPHLRPAEAVLEDLGSSAEQGLSDHESKRRRHRHGPNRLRRAAARPAWRILIDQLKSVVVILLLAAAGAAALFDRLVEAVAIGAAVLVNTIIGFTMELRATRAMEALARMGESQTRVLRGGRALEIPADDLVPGDLVLLEAGDLVGADLRLVESNRLQVDESALTGESVAVDKGSDPLDAPSSGDDIPLAERTNMAFKGTAVTAGSGSGVVVATGMDTELGRIAHLVEQAGESLTPLERRLDALGRRLVWLTLGVAVVVAAAGLAAGKDLLVMLETALALAVAAVPEGLPVVATLALAQGMRRMARRNAVVKRLAAVETLGAASLIFTDKTGTLTENHMTLARLALARGDLRLAGNGDQDRRFEMDGQPADPADLPELRAALEVGALCNNASLGEDGPVGDPTEVSLLEGAARADIHRPSLLEAWPETREVSFDPELKLMATFHARDDGQRVAVKGAPEAVLPLCERVSAPEGAEPLDPEGREAWGERADTLAADGLRVLALAEKDAADADSDPYEDLTLLALAGLYDPPRADIASAIADCQGAGIRVVMGTGDHAATAAAIGAEIGLEGSEAGALTASRIGDSLTRTGDAADAVDPDTREAVLGHSIFARVSPEQKLGIIRLYQDAGWIVGMTGDGVNDAPALQQADIGIAMGRRGTEVAREAADMVLMDDAFATIVAAVEHGRTIFENIRRFIVYLLSGNLGEIMAISAAAVVGAPLPMLPLQILYINFVSDVMPALALGLSPGRPGVMRHPPRDADEPILTRRHWIATLGYGAIIAAAVLAAFAAALLWLGLPRAEAVTVGFLTFGFARLWHLFNMRDPGSPLLVNEITRNPFAWISIAVGIALLLAAIAIPVLAEVLSTAVPGPAGWTLCLGFSFIPLIVVQGMKAARIGWEGG